MTVDRQVDQVDRMGEGPGIEKVVGKDIVGEEDSRVHRKVAGS